MIVLVKKYARGVEIRFAGHLDSVSSPAAMAALQTLPEPLGDQLLFNFSELDYVSSAGLRVILTVAKAAKAKGKISLVMTGLNENVREIFEIAGFESLLRPVERFDYKTLGPLQE